MRFRPVPFLVLVSAGATASAQIIPQIQNVVVIVQENRTPDNLFHYLAPACPIPANAAGLTACTPAPVTSNCYNVAPCGVSNQGGTPVPVTLHSVPLYGSVDPNHSHGSFELMCDRDPATLLCRNDGAWRIANPAGAAFGFVANSAITNYDGSAGHILDPYLTFAKNYGWANYMYQTNQGPSYPAHQYLFSGTSAVTAANDLKSTYISGTFNYIYQSGCMAPAGSTNYVISPALSTPPANCTVFADGSVQECPVSNTALIYPTDPVGSFCNLHLSMGDLLDQRGVSWKYYASQAGDLTTAPVSFKSICQPAFMDSDQDSDAAPECTGTEWTTHVDLKQQGADVLSDIFNCNLPRVSWVVPDDRWSDHAGPNDLYGPSWVAAIINSIGKRATCPAGTPDAGQNFWQNTAILLVWDDWGGWSDHELPQPAPRISSKLPCRSTWCPADYEGGFRVPLVVVSAYTPAGLISNVPHDFGSILRMIEWVNHLQEGQLGFADARAGTDLQEFFTLTSPRTYHSVFAQKNATFFLTLPANLPAIQPDND